MLAEKINVYIWNEYGTMTKETAKRHDVKNRFREFVYKAR